MTKLKSNDIETNKGIHTGHRKRVKERFKQGGLEAFQKHEVLEFLLFFGIPYKDTNEIAHNLINKFGSFANVFDAPIESLMEVSGMTENAAVLIKMLPSVARLYRHEKIAEKHDISTFTKCREYLSNLLYDSTKEEFYLMSLDSDNKLINCSRLAMGTVNRVTINVRDVIERALRDRAVNVVIAHNHPSHIPFPSNDDYRTTKTIVLSLSYVDINVYDHIIISGGQYYSLSRNGELDKLKGECPKNFLSTFAEANKKWLDD